MKRKAGSMQSRLNVDLNKEYSKMVEFLKYAYGLSYGAELVRVLIKNAYDREKGPYSLEK
jgi:hypothetical protein